MRTNILCAGEILGAAIGEAGNISFVATPGPFDRLATLAETEAHCAEFNNLGWGQPIYAKPADDCRYNAPRA